MESDTLKDAFSKIVGEIDRQDRESKGYSTYLRQLVQKARDVIHEETAHTEVLHGLTERLHAEKIVKLEEELLLEKRISKNHSDTFTDLCAEKLKLEAEKKDLSEKLDFALKSCKEATDGIEERNVKIQALMGKLDVADKTLKHEIDKRAVLEKFHNELLARERKLRETFYKRDKFRSVIAETLERMDGADCCGPAGYYEREGDKILRKIFAGPMLEALGIETPPRPRAAGVNALLDVMEEASDSFKDTISPANKERIALAVLGWIGKPANPPAPSPGTDKKTLGLYQKYHVTRTDGKPVSWCFVIEEKDPLGWAALKVYAILARRTGYEALAKDLETKCAEIDAKIHPQKFPDDSWTALLFGGASVHYRKWAGAAMQHLEAAIPRLEACAKGGCPECGRVAEVHKEFLERARTKAGLKSCDEPK